MLTEKITEQRNINVCIHSDLHYANPNITVNICRAHKDGNRTKRAWDPQKNIKFSLV